MRQKFSQRFVHELEQHTQSADLQKLVDQGYRSIRVVPRDHLQHIVQETMRRLKDDPEMSRGVLAKVQDELRRQLGVHKDLKEKNEALSTQKHSLESRVESLKTQLGEAQRELAGEEDQQAKLLREGLREQLEIELSAWLLPHDQKFHDRLDALLRRTVYSALRRMKRATPESGCRSDLLQRRVQKLVNSLAEAHHQIEALQQKCETHETGQRSVYRKVQGLKRDDAHFSTKRGMMQDLFRQNQQDRKA